MKWYFKIKHILKWYHLQYFRKGPFLANSVKQCQNISSNAHCICLEDIDIKNKIYMKVSYTDEQIWRQLH